MKTNKHISLISRISNTLTELLKLDVRSLAAFRIGLGCLILLDLIMRLPDIIAFYTDTGILPRGIILNGLSNMYRLSIHNMSGQLWFQLVLFGTSAIIAILLIIGYRTKMMTFLSWVLLISLHNRNEYVTQGGDATFQLLLFWSLFLPLGIAFSIDSLWKSKILSKYIDPEIDVEITDEQPFNDTKSHKIITVGSITYIAQILLMILFAGLQKNGAAWYGPYYNAAMYAAHVQYLTTPLSRWSQTLPLIFHQIFTIYLKWVEIITPVLLLIPYKNHIFRSVGIVLMVILLIVCGLSLQIAYFPYIWIVSLAPFIPSHWWNWIDSKWNQQKPQLTFFYDQECMVCTSAACALQRAVTVQTCQSDDRILEKMLTENTMTVIDEDGVEHTHFDAMLQLMRVSILTAWLVPIMRLPVLKTVGQWKYKWIAHNRYIISDIIEWLKPKPAPHIKIPQLFTSSIAIFLILYVASWNLGSIQPFFVISPPFDSIAYTLNINQSWEMFSTPPQASSYLMIPGTLEDGTKVDVFWEQEGDVISSYEDNQVPPPHYRSQGWRKYLVEYVMPSKVKTDQYFAQYLCRRWNTDQTDSNKLLKSFDMYIVTTGVDDYGNKTTSTTQQLLSQICY